MPDPPRTPEGGRANRRPRSTRGDTIRDGRRDRRWRVAWTQSSVILSRADGEGSPATIVEILPPLGGVRMTKLRLRPCAAAALRRDRFLFGVVDLEHRVEFRELEQLHDPLGRIDEDQLSILGRELAEVADQLTDAGGVDVVDLREVDDDVGALVLEHVLERR